MIYCCYPDYTFQLHKLVNFSSLTDMNGKYLSGIIVAIYLYEK
jgi:hypothetical protein